MATRHVSLPERSWRRISSKVSWPDNSRSPLPLIPCVRRRRWIGPSSVESLDFRQSESDAQAPSRHSIGSQSRLPSTVHPLTPGVILTLQSAVDTSQSASRRRSPISRRYRARRLPNGVVRTTEKAVTWRRFGHAGDAGAFGQGAWRCAQIRANQSPTQIPVNREIFREIRRLWLGKLLYDVLKARQGATLVVSEPKIRAIGTGKRTGREQGTIREGNREPDS